MKFTLLGFMLFASTAYAADTPRVYIESAQTVDASRNAQHKAEQIDFGSAIAGAFMKKKVPVLVVTDKDKSDWTIRAVASQKEDSTATKTAKLVVRGIFAGNFTKFEGSLQVIDNESTAVIFAFNVKRSNFKKAAEAFAGRFKKEVRKLSMPR